MIDVDQQINSVRRTVGTRTLEAGEARVLTVSRTYPTDPDDLWEACTSIERIPRWFLPITGELKVGGHFQFEGNAGGTIERCDPPHAFAATWEFGGDVSWVEVRLSAEPDGGTRFELEHVAHVDDERWGGVRARRRRRRLGEWPARADPAPGGPGCRRHGGGCGERGAAWAASDEGKRFMTLASDAWAEASIAAGARRGRGPGRPRSARPSPTPEAEPAGLKTDLSARNARYFGVLRTFRRQTRRS